MAERRMFAKTIIDSDAFIDMPMSARLLYYDLAMRADDDGFVNSPKKIMKFVGASTDDINILIAKQFVIPFESGVVVIRHWKIHNYIKNDRYKGTAYVTEKSSLKLDENKAYFIDNNKCIQNGTTLDTQDRLELEIDKDRLESGKDRLDNKYLQADVDSTDIDDSSPQAEAENCPFAKIKDLYHKICISYPKLRSIDGNRKKAIAARWRTYKSLDIFEEMFKIAENSSFLKGNNDRNWSADFDWMMKPTNFSKILEHKYDDRTETGGTKLTGVLGIMQKIYEEAEE